jgi:type VI protein secretion system component VasK
MVMLGIIVAVVLAVAWLVALTLAIMDSIPVGEKILWVIALTVLAPIAIPVYLVLRSRRRRTQEAAVVPPG